MTPRSSIRRSNASTDLLWKRRCRIIDGAVNGVGETIQGMAAVLKNVQNGLIRSYAAWILLGTVAILLYISCSGDKRDAYGSSEYPL